MKLTRLNPARIIPKTESPTDEAVPVCGKVGAGVFAAGVGFLGCGFSGSGVVVLTVLETTS